MYSCMMPVVLPIRIQRPNSQTKSGQKSEEFSSLLFPCYFFSSTNVYFCCLNSKVILYCNYLLINFNLYKILKNNDTPRPSSQVLQFCYLNRLFVLKMSYSATSIRMLYFYLIFFCLGFSGLHDGRIRFHQNQHRQLQQIFV